MAELKTRRTRASVPDFLAAVADPGRRSDAQALCDLMSAETAQPPAMWGSAIVGFGEYTYHYGPGRQGSWPAVGFSPRKQSLTVYLSIGFDGYGHLLERLGRHTHRQGLPVPAETVRSGRWSAAGAGAVGVPGHER